MFPRISLGAPIMSVPSATQKLSGNAIAKRETDVKPPPKKEVVTADDWQQLVAKKDADGVDLQLAVVLPDGKRENLQLTDNTPLKVGLAAAQGEHLAGIGIEPAWDEQGHGSN